MFGCFGSKTSNKKRAQSNANLSKKKNKSGNTMPVNGKDSENGYLMEDAKDNSSIAGSNSSNTNNTNNNNNNNNNNNKRRYSSVGTTATNTTPSNSQYHNNNTPKSDLDDCSSSHNGITNNNNNNNNKLDCKKALQWNEIQVSEWFKTIGYPNYSERMLENHITGKDLLELNKTDLKDMDINIIGHIKNILRHIHALQEINNYRPFIYSPNNPNHQIHRTSHSRIVSPTQNLPNDSSNPGIFDDEPSSQSERGINGLNAGIEPSLPNSSEVINGHTSDNQAGSIRQKNSLDANGDLQQQPSSSSIALSSTARHSISDKTLNLGKYEDWAKDRDTYQGLWNQWVGYRDVMTLPQFKKLVTLANVSDSTGMLIWQRLIEKNSKKPEVASGVCTFPQFVLMMKLIYLSQSGFPLNLVDIEYLYSYHPGIPTLRSTSNNWEELAKAQMTENTVVFDGLPLEILANDHLLNKFNQKALHKFNPLYFEVDDAKHQLIATFKERINTQNLQDIKYQCTIALEQMNYNKSGSITSLQLRFPTVSEFISSNQSHYHHKYNNTSSCSSISDFPTPGKRNSLMNGGTMDSPENITNDIGCSNPDIPPPPPSFPLPPPPPITMPTPDGLGDDHIRTFEPSSNNQTNNHTISNETRTPPSQSSGNEGILHQGIKNGTPKSGWISKEPNVMLPSALSVISSYGPEGNTIEEKKTKRRNELSLRREKVDGGDNVSYANEIRDRIRQGSIPIRVYSKTEIETLLQSENFWDIFSTRVNIPSLKLSNTSVIRTRIAMNLIAQLRGVAIRTVKFNDKGVVILSGKTLVEIEKLLSDCNAQTIADLLDVNLEDYPMVQKGLSQDQEAWSNPNSKSNTPTFGVEQEETPLKQSSEYEIQRQQQQQQQQQLLPPPPPVENAKKRGSQDIRVNLPKINGNKDSNPNENERAPLKKEDPSNGNDNGNENSNENENKIKDDQSEIKNSSTIVTANQ